MDLTAIVLLLILVILTWVSLAIFVVEMVHEKCLPWLDRKNCGAVARCVGGTGTQ